MSEAQVQTFMKSHLHLLEMGLTLIGVGVHVRDSSGSDGYIDILARDSQGYHVIIEIKLQRSAAREGLQELAKYIRLYAEQTGLTSARMRCILVSSDWSELDAAFTELKPAFPCRLTGYKYKIGADGTPQDFALVLPRTSVDHLSLSPYHFLIVAENASSIEHETKKLEFRQNE